MERLTEKLNGKNVIPLRHRGKIKWSICSVRLGDTCTEYLYGDHADRLAAIEDILGDDYDLDRLKIIMDAERCGHLLIGCGPGDPGKRGPVWQCPICGMPHPEWDPETDTCRCGNCGWDEREESHG